MTSVIRWLGRGLTLGCFALASWPALAELPTARISQLRPPGGRIGTTFELTVSGSDLDDAVRLYFSHTGITAVPKGDGNKFTVTIASNIPPGIYEARFLGRFGLSNPRAFSVSSFAESTAPGTNTTAAKAFAMTLNSTINGQAQANSIDWYQFTAKKSQRLLVECLADTIDSRMDPALAVVDAAGRELERAHATGLLDFTAPSDGTFLIMVADFLYRGGDGYFYRLTLSDAPHIDYIFPPAGVPGTKTNFTVYGRNLPGGKTVKGQTIDGKAVEQLTVEIAFPRDDRTHRLNTCLPVRPAAAAIDGFDYRLQTPKGVSNPFLLGFASAPVVLEQEPNDKPAQAQKLNLPCEVAGQFHPSQDRDWYAFEAKKGDVYAIEIFSYRLGLPTDPSVLVQRITKNDKGEEQLSDLLELADNDTNLGDREFNTVSRDPSGRLEIKEDGAYRLLVRDLSTHAQRTPHFVYRLSIRRESPDFRLVAVPFLPKAKADAKNIDLAVPLLRRGETIAIKVLAFRQAFSGPIDLSLEQPPPGLLFHGDRIDAEKTSDYILLTAADDAPAFAGPVRLIGKAKAGDKELVREARGATLVFPVENIDNERPKARLARDFTLAISDQEHAPLSITPAEAKTWEAPANGKLQIPLRIRRQADFTARLKLKPIGPGTAEALKEFDVDGQATNATLTLDLAALKLAPGDYVFSAQTQAAGKYRNNPEAASFAEAAAKEADKHAGELDAAAKKASADLDAASQTAKAADAAAKSAEEKLAAAKTALEKTPTDEKLVAEHDAAGKTAEEKFAAAKAADEAKASAEKAKTDAQTRAKEAQARKETASGRAKETAERAKPKDVTVTVHSAPISVKVKAVEQAKTK